jgi:hypothetical protein
VRDTNRTDAIEFEAVVTPRLACDRDHLVFLAASRSNAADDVFERLIEQSDTQGNARLASPTWESCT